MAVVQVHIVNAIYRCWGDLLCNVFFGRKMSRPPDTFCEASSIYYYVLWQAYFDQVGPVMQTIKPNAFTLSYLCGRVGGS